MRLLLSFLLSLTLLIPISAHDWSNTLAKVSRSMVRLHTTQEGGVCSGFIINEQKQYVMTAAHCALESGITVDALPSFILLKDETLDLAIVSNLGQHRPALRPSTRIPRSGLPIAAVGYGYGTQGLLSRMGNISSPGLNLEEDGGGIWLFMDSQYIGGMSGGPVVDTDGNVISIVQMADSLGSGYGRPLGAMREFAKAYWR